jgi:hypothetical protein
MKKKCIVGFFVLLVLGFIVLACGKEKDINYSVQVNNKAAMKAITDTDTVELFIANMEYIEDANPRGMIIIAANDREADGGKKLNNAGWYSIRADLDVHTYANNGPYSLFFLKISKLRVNGTEYVFPVNHDGDHQMGGDAIDGFAASLGNIVRPFWAGENYPNNFSGINMTDSVVSLKTVLIVEPEIIGTPDSEGYDSQGLALDPFRFIKVEGRVNE